MRWLSSYLAVLAFLAPSALGSEIGRTITGGPSLKPSTKCYNHEEIEKGDVVVMHFTASIDESSPSGVPGTVITTSRGNSTSGGPLSVPVATATGGWDVALLGMCEGDSATLVVPPQYVHGEAFDGKDVPEDAILRIDVEIWDILVDETDDSDDSFDSDDSSDSSEEEEL